MAEDDLSQWWDEDAERLNKLAEAARKIAVKVPQWEDAVEESRAFCPTGSGGGVDNSCSSSASGADADRSVSIGKLIQKIAENPQGFTLDPLSAEQPSSGIMVSQFQNDSRRSVKIKASQIESAEGYERLSHWYSDNADVLVGQGDRFVGGWRTGDDYYVDVATRFPPEKAAEALEAGREAGQLAVFNLGTFKETWVQYDADDKRKPAGFDKDFARARKDSSVKQVYEPDTPDLQDEDWADELARHGKTTVRAYNQEPREDASDGRKHSAIRHSEQAHDHRGFPRDADLLREGRSLSRQEARSGVVRRRPGESAAPLQGSAAPAEERAFCATGDGGGIDNSCGASDAPADAFGQDIGGYNRTGSASQQKGGGRVDSSWRRQDNAVAWDSDKLRESPPAKSLANVSHVVMANGRAVKDALSGVGVSLDNAAKVGAPLDETAHVLIGSGSFAEMMASVTNPGSVPDGHPAVTFISKVTIADVDEAASIVTTVTRNEDDELLLIYNALAVSPQAREKASTAVGRQMYKGVINSLEQAEKAGVQEVSMIAAGDASDERFSGYKIWPRLGFDGVIPRNKVTPLYTIRRGFFEKYGSSLPDEILSDRAKQEKSQGALTVQALYETPEGQKWWEQNGGEMKMTIRPGDDSSPGWQRFKRIRERVSGRSIDEWLDALGVEARAFCPTGSGGGVDNSCSAGEGSAAVDSSWKQEDSFVTWNRESLRSDPPVKSDVPLDMLTIDSAPGLKDFMDDMGIASLDDVISLGGGFVRDASVSIAAGDGYAATVTTIFPVESGDTGLSRGAFSQSVSISQDSDGKHLGFETFGPTGPSAADEQQGKLKVASLMMEKVAESISTAEKLGFADVSMFAIGQAGDRYRGYSLWPQFGFDGDISREIVRKVPKELLLKSKGVAIPAAGASRAPQDLVIKSLASRYKDLTVQELTSTREGKVWWDANGGDIDLKLDLTDKSSQGYKKWTEMKARLARLKDRNQSRSFWDEFVEERAFCATGEGGGIDNSCSAGDEGPTNAFGESVEGFARTGPSRGGLGKTTMTDVMLGGKPTVVVIDQEATSRAKEDYRLHPKPEGSAPGSATDLWDREFAERAGIDRPEEGAATKIISLSPAFSPDRLRQNGSYVAHEAVGQFLSMRHEEARAKVAGDKPAAIIDTQKPLSDEQRGYIVDSLADDAVHAYEIGGFDPGFYDSDLKLAMRSVAKMHPEIEHDDNARFMFTMLTAITSNGQDPDTNLVDAEAIYRMHKEHGTVVPAKGQKSDAGDEAGGDVGGARDIKSSLVRLQGMLDAFGVDRTRRLLSGYTTVEKLNTTLRKLSEKSGDPDWRGRTGSNPWMIDHFSQPPAKARLVQQGVNNEFPDEVVPVASIFGPKIGSFFANLSGRHDFLTMDRWLMRSVGRVTGELITRSTPQSASNSAAKALEALKASRSSKMLFGVGLTKAEVVRSLKVQQRTGVVEENGAAMAWAKAAARSYANTPRAGGTGSFGRHEDQDIHAAHEAGNAISKQLIFEQQTPRGAMARRQIREVFRDVVTRIEERYPDRKGQVDVDEVQAVLWQYEKNLWKHLGAKVKIDRNSLYSKAAEKLLAREKQKTLKPEKRSFGEYADWLDDAEPRDWDSVPFGAEQFYWDSDVEQSGISLNEVAEALEIDGDDSYDDFLDELVRVAESRGRHVTASVRPDSRVVAAGFDAKLPRGVLRMLPESLSHCETLIDLHVTAEGRSWWAENARSVSVSIDLSDRQSVQSRMFERFSAESRSLDVEKHWEDIIEEGILDDYGNS